MQYTLSSKAQSRLKNIAESELLDEHPPFTQLNDLLDDADMLKSPELVAAVLSDFLSRCRSGAGRVEAVPSFYFANPSDVGCHLAYIRSDIRFTNDIRRLFTFTWSGHPAVRWARPLTGEALRLAKHAFEAKQREDLYRSRAVKDLEAFTAVLWARADDYCMRNKPRFTVEQLNDLADFFACRQKPAFVRDIESCAWFCQIMGITLSDLRSEA